jgi:oligopeptide/dipeptide ABC transporter ATP-binding protein
MALLEVDGLKTWFFTDAGVAPSVDGVSFTIDRGETVGIVGESGCGKSVTAMSILRLIPEPPGRIVAGEVRLDGRDLVRLPMTELRKIRGGDVAMVFQEPMTSLNPVYTVGDQIVEAILLHQDVEEERAWDLALQMLERVGIPAAGTRIHEYPHQLSGGMKQRVMIAMALSCQPRLLIADEPTTALDVTIQAQILELLKTLQTENGMGIMLITHDLGVVAETCDKVVVLYAGKMAEVAPTLALFDSAAHPYTRGLLRSLPDRAVPGERLATIPGMVPSPLHFPSGCRFRTRCERADAACEAEPPEVDLGSGHRVWCHHPEGARS